MKEKIEELEESLDGSDNYHTNFPHTDRDGLIGYHLYFRGDWLFDRTVETIKAHGLEIKSMALTVPDLDRYEYCTFKVLVVEKDTEIKEV